MKRNNCAFLKMTEKCSSGILKVEFNVAVFRVLSTKRFDLSEILSSGTGGIMRKYVCAILICTVLLVMGCSAGTPDAAASEKMQSTGKAAQVQEQKEETKAPVEAAADTAAAAASVDASAAQKEQAEGDGAGEAVEKESAKAETKKAAEEKEPAKAESETEEAEKEAEGSEKKSEGSEKEAAAPQKEKKQDKDLKQESKEKYENDYIPDGFTPYGSYVMVYDSGYEVKTRLSKAGLTYYYGSEEFLFTLDKDLPDMTREVAHILFNNAGPMDPADTKGEEFPFSEGFMIYINLDDGSYYEVSSASLDLDGRVFARDIFELFRQKWEGAF